MLDVTLKRRSSTLVQTEQQVPPLRRRLRSGFGRNDRGMVGGQIKFNIKGNGQECPFYMSEESHFILSLDA
jgi:hypothetical protein